MKGRVLLNAGSRPYLSIKLKGEETPVALIKQVLSLLAEGAAGEAPAS